MKLRAIAVIAAVAATSLPASAQVIDNENIMTKGTRAPSGPVQAGQPLPRNAPVARDQKPAFPEQRGAPAVITKTPLDVRVVTTNLNRPWGLAFIDDKHAIITEKPGAIRIVDLRSGAIVSNVEGVPAVVFGGDAGLLDIVTDPQFSTNGQIFLTYVEPRGGGANGVVVAKARLQRQARENEPARYMLQDQKIVLRVEPGIVGLKHYGARLAFDRDGSLFVSLSERFFSPYRDEAQSIYSWGGKVLKVTTDGKPVVRNPFITDQTAENHPRGEIWSIGHRNPQAMAIHPVTGQLWVGEHGPQGGDELNLIKSGANYGWPIVAYGTNYDGTTINGGRTDMRGAEQPRYYWDPTIAPGGMSFYSGDLIPEWKNNLFVAALAGQHVARLIIAGDKVMGEERLLLDQNQRIRDVKQGPDGSLWVITDDPSGRLIRVGPAPAGSPSVSQVGSAH